MRFAMFGAAETHTRFGVGTLPALNFSRAQCQAQDRLRLFFPNLRRRAIVVAGMGWISVIAIGFRLKVQIYGIFAPLSRGFCIFNNF